MRQNSFGKLWPVSVLTLGSGGIGMVWGETTFDECVGTVHDAGTKPYRAEPEVRIHFPPAASLRTFVPGV
jgi:hypothetical protein